MDSTKLQQIIDQRIDQKLGSMTNMAVPNHFHNSYDANQLDPAVALLGFPIIQVADASISPLVSNPNDKPLSGTFRFYVDTVPLYYLWAYLSYQTATGALVSAWKSIQLT